MTNQEIGQLIVTADGSHTLYMNELDETYHSIHGAVAESRHIYIQSGLEYIKKNTHLNILEVGFGTGLNALLTYQNQNIKNIQVNYIALEPYPLPLELTNQLNYSDILKTDKKVFNKMHSSKSAYRCALTPSFFFTKNIQSIEEAIFEANFFDLIYFDLFNPVLKLEIWGLAIFQKIYNASKSGAILVTYSTKGVIRRAMKEAGFIVEKIPGPTGKREITRATKP